MADALSTYGALNLDQAELTRALASYRSSLAEWESAQVSLRVAGVKRQIGASLAELGVLQQDQARLHESIAYYVSSKNEFEAQNALFEWAFVQLGLGDSYRQLGVVQASQSTLEDSLSSYQEALMIWTRSRWPTLWASAQWRTCAVLADLWSLSKNDQYLQRALTACEDAREIIRHGDDISLSIVELDIVRILIMSGEWNHAVARLDNLLGGKFKYLEEQLIDGPDWLVAGNMWLALIDVLSIVEMERYMYRVGSSLQAHLDREGSALPVVDWLHRVVLSRALEGYARLKGNSSSLVKATEELRLAVESISFESAPGIWALTYVALGNVLGAMGEMREDELHLTEAISAYEKALGVLTKERAPDVWHSLQGGLGAALATKGWLEHDPDIIRRGLAMLSRLKSGFTQVNLSAYYLELGKAWIRLGELEQDALSLDTGIESVRQAMKGVDRAYQPIHWAILQGWLGQATVALEKLRRVPSGSLNDGLEAIQESLEVFRNVGASHYVGIAERNLARAEALLAERRGDSAAE